MDLLVEIATLVERIRAIAKTGLAFKPDSYDGARYRDLLDAAAALEARLSGADERTGASLARRWASEVLPGRDGYVTVGFGCGALVFNRADELLMIERPDGGWLFPSGWCDVGDSPAKTAVKEVREETGLEVEPTALVGLLDSRFMGVPGRHFVMALFHCRMVGGEIRPDRNEALKADFFPLDSLPQPLHVPNPGWIELAQRVVTGRTGEPFFE